MPNIEYKIVENLGVISEGNKGWNRELNLIQWNNSTTPKYDLRDWAPDHLRMAKGITLSKEEMIALRDVLNKIDLD